MRNIFKIILVIILAIIAKNLIFSIHVQLTNTDTVTTLEQDLQMKKYDNEFLKQKLSYVKSNEFVEKQARDKLGLVKQGEFIVIGPGPVQKQKNEPLQIQDDTPNYKKWWKLFFD